MAKEKKPTKSKRDEQARMLDLLRSILPKVAPDAAFADKIYSAFEAELRATNPIFVVRIASLKRGETVVLYG